MLGVLAFFAAAAAVQQPVPEPLARAARYEQLYADTGNEALLWLTAEAYAEAGDRVRATEALRHMVGRGLGFTVTADSPLHKLAGNAEFDAVAAALQREPVAVRAARVAATVAWRGLVPEGIAADPRSGRLYVGDMAGKQILWLRPGGKSRRFATTGRLRPLGMKVDPQGRLLWVAASTAFVAVEPPKSALLAFDLRSGQLARSVTSPELKSINDLAFAPNGDIYATDSLGGALFRLRRGADRLERVTPADVRMSYPNGVAVSGDGQSVYVAQGVALRRVDAATGAVTSLPPPKRLALLSLDGLLWDRGDLIAVQNAGAMRVLRLQLSADGSRIESHRTIEAGNPDFDLPTTAALLGRRLYVIANSQLQRLGDDGRITPGPPLKPVKLLEIRLEK